MTNRFPKNSFETIQKELNLFKYYKKTNFKKKKKHDVLYI